MIEEYVEEVGGIMYSFSVLFEIVDVVINKLNFYVLFGGFVIFKNVK